MIEGILIEGFIYSLLTLGVFLTFRVINFADLTVEGSFPLGASISAILIVYGYNPYFSLFFSFFAGILAGFVTAILHNKLKIPDLLSGILTLTMIYSLNIRILGNRSNLPLINKPTIFKEFINLINSIKIFQTLNQELLEVIFIGIFVIIMFFLIYLFLVTELGLLLRAQGNNERLIINAGLNPELLKLIGIGLANGLVAVSGGLVAQYQGFADVSLGQGIIIWGLASLMIGEVVVNDKSLLISIFRIIIGTIVFKTIMYLGRFYGYLIRMTPNDLKMVTGILVILSIILSKSKNTNLFKYFSLQQQIKK